MSCEFDPFSHTVAKVPVCRSPLFLRVQIVNWSIGSIQWYLALKSLLLKEKHNFTLSTNLRNPSDFPAAGWKFDLVRKKIIGRAEKRRFAELKRLSENLSFQGNELVETCVAR